MSTIGVIREFKTKNFRVVVDAVEDDYLPLDLFSDDQKEQTLHDLEIGRLVAFCARARVFFQGTEVASDYLGGCIYKSLEDFAACRPGYFDDMVSIVCKEARKTVCRMLAIKIRGCNGNSAE